MALDIFQTYQPNAIAADANYPEGSLKDETVPGAGDGTPITTAFGNDLLGFFQKLLSDNGIIANNTSDTAQLSQYFQGLEQTIRAHSLGRNWIAKSLGTTESWSSGTYGAGKYLVASTTGPSRQHFAYSTDAKTWTTGTITAFDSLTADNIIQAASDGTNLVLLNPVGSDAYLSTDGVSWSPQAITVGGSPSTLAGVKSLKWIEADSQYICVRGGTSADILTSPNGYAWTVVYSITNGPLGGVTHDEDSDNYVAVRSGTTNNNERVFTSPDSVTWTARNSADDTVSWFDVDASDDGIIAAVSFDGSAQRGMYSKDGGLTWSLTRTAGDSFGWTNLSFIEGVFMAAAGSPRAAIMVGDGVAWSAGYNSLEDVVNDTPGFIFSKNKIAISVSIGKLYISGISAS